MPLVFPTGQSKSIIVCRYALARRELPIEGSGVEYNWQNNKSLAAE